MKRVLYISYDGMTDPLGQSQVMPYLIGLSRLGHRITILSCEKKHNFVVHADRCSQRLRAAEIDWHHVPYTKRPPILSTWYDLRKMEAKGGRLLGEESFDIVHCRTVLSTLVGHRLKGRAGAKLIFDIRGFWADERVDGHLWDLGNPVYRLVYNYFKRREMQFFRDSDLVITLTERARDYIGALDWPADFAPIIRVVPCCADTAHFSRDRFDADSRSDIRRKLGIPEDSFVLTYVGSLGTRYLLHEMLRFFAAVACDQPDARFLFVTQDAHDSIFSVAAEAGVERSQVVITASTYDEIPESISVSDASVFFITTGSSGIAVSPTKQAELLAMGVPIVCNSGIGDCDSIIGDTGAGIVIESLDDAGFAAAARRLSDVKGFDHADIRALATDRLSLESGIRRYHEAWEAL